MITFITYFFAFLLTLLILVSIHEFGHFWVARKMGVKVLRFSIGMGKPLWTKKGKDGVEYVFAMLPLGGYVKMLGEGDEEVAKDEKHQAFNQASIKARAAIVIAGPLFNLILAVVLLWGLNIVGSTGLMPLIGQVTPHSDADKAGFLSGDEIIQVGDKETPTWQNVIYQMVSTSINSDHLELQVRQKDGNLVSKNLPIATILKYEKDKNILKSLGLSRYLPPVPIILGRIIPNKPADLAGLKKGDKVLSVDGKAVQYWKEWSQLVQASPNKKLTFKIERDGFILTKKVTPITLTENNKTVVRIGVYGADHTDLYAPYLRKTQYDTLDALQLAFTQTGENALLIINGIKKMITGELSYMNMGGPATIVQMAGKTATYGLLSFISFLALLSVNLGVINLLPIPILDGGHLLYLTIEGIKGSPLSEKNMAQAQILGMIMLASLMTLAIYVDFVRFLG